MAAPRDATNTPMYAPAVPYGKETIWSTHDFCRPTTWWSTSTRITNETLTVDGDWYQSAHANWIDLYHGWVFDERAIRADVEHQYAVVIIVNGVQKTARAPFATSGGDYEIDYDLGRVRPFSSWAGQTVSGSYSHSTSSVFVLKPSEGKVLKIEDAEVQFSDPITMTSAVKMEVYAYADYFAPQLGLPAGTLIPIEATYYDRMYQVIDEAKDAYPEIPALGGASRGMLTPMQIFKFKYGRMRKLFSSLGFEIRISVVDDIPYEGERMTATFYCASVTDPGAAVALDELSKLSQD